MAAASNISNTTTPINRPSRSSNATPAAPAQGASGSPTDFSALIADLISDAGIAAADAPAEQDEGSMSDAVDATHGLASAQDTALFTPPIDLTQTPSALIAAASTASNEADASGATMASPTLALVASPLAGPFAGSAAAPRSSDAVLPRDTTRPALSVAAPIAELAGTDTHAAEVEQPAQVDSNSRAVELDTLRTAPTFAHALRETGPLSTAYGHAHAATIDTQAPLGSQAWAQETSVKLIALAERGITGAEMTVHPRELGPIRVLITLNDSGASVGFFVANDDTGSLLQNAIPELSKLMSEGGLNLSQSFVSRDPQGRWDGPTGQPRGAYRARDDEPNADALAAGGARPGGRVLRGLVDLFA